MKPDSVPISVLCLWSVSGSCHLLSFPLPCPSTVHPQCHCLPWHLSGPRSMTSPRPCIGMAPSSLCPLQSVSKPCPQLAFVVGTNSQELSRACCVPSSVLDIVLAFPKCSFHGGDPFFCLFGCAGFSLWQVGFSVWLWFMGWVALWHVGS